jgi:glycosyltransferase involved in cell wall biosynthesis
MISALVHTRNERQQLPGCLDSLRWADEIVVADMASDDGTREIAASYQARLIDMPMEPIVERVRNRAATECRGDWLLVIDADERVSPALAQRIHELTNVSDAAAYSIPRKNYFLGVWLEHGNWPDPQIRLARRGKIQWSEMVHEHPTVDGRVIDLPADPLVAIEHPGYAVDLGRFMAKQLRYSQLDAQRLETKIAPLVWPWILRRPLSEFYGRYMKEGAWRHGMHGLIWSGLMAVYQFQLAAHYWDRRRKLEPGDATQLRRQTRLEIWRAAVKWLR